MSRGLAASIAVVEIVSCAAHTDLPHSKSGAIPCCSGVPSTEFAGAQSLTVLGEACFNG